MKKEVVAIVFGSLTFLLFALTPYILDFIEPSKSLGQTIGENTKDFFKEFFEKEEDVKSKREVWKDLLTITSFFLFVTTMIFATLTVQENSKKYLGIGGGLLALLGLLVYLSSISLGYISIIVIAILIYLAVKHLGE